MSEALIIKTVLHAGTENVVFEDGAKVVFHYQARKADDESKIIDDSRKEGKPMELILGKGFRFEAWETMVKMMALNEIAKFRVDKTLATFYPFVSKTIRDAAKPSEDRRRHCCGATLQNEGLGYGDLDELVAKPWDMEFTIELLKVEPPGQYKQESWQMNEGEKLCAVPNLHQKGNKLYSKKDYSGAAKLYAEALGYLEQLMLSEKPGDEEWNELNNLKLPILLNFAQCKLHENSYNEAIEHCNTVLKDKPGNVKALFRRGKAHVGAWNPREARADFERVMQLDPSLTAAVKKELRLLDDIQRKRDEEDRARFKGKIF